MNGIGDNVVANAAFEVASRLVYSVAYFFVAVSFMGKTRRVAIAGLDSWIEARGLAAAATRATADEGRSGCARADSATGACPDGAGGGEAGAALPDDSMGEDDVLADALAAYRRKRGQRRPGRIAGAEDAPSEPRPLRLAPAVLLLPALPLLLSYGAVVDLALDLYVPYVPLHILINLKYPLLFAASVLVALVGVRREGLSNARLALSVALAAVAASAAALILPGYAGALLSILPFVPGPVAWSMAGAVWCAVWLVPMAVLIRRLEPAGASAFPVSHLTAKNVLLAAACLVVLASWAAGGQGASAASGVLFEDLSPSLASSESLAAMALWLSSFACVWRFGRKVP